MACTVLRSSPTPSPGTALFYCKILCTKYSIKSSVIRCWHLTSGYFRSEFHSALWLLYQRHFKLYSSLWERLVAKLWGSQRDPFWTLRSSCVALCQLQNAPTPSQARGLRGSRAGAELPELNQRATASSQRSVLSVGTRWAALRWAQGMRRSTRPCVVMELSAYPSGRRRNNLLITRVSNHKQVSRWKSLHCYLAVLIK